MKQSICIVFNHFQPQDGVCRSAIAMANLLCETKQVEVTLIPIFHFDASMCSTLHPNVHIHSIFRGYFRGFAQLLRRVPASWLYRLFVRETYNIEIAFQFGIATYALSASKRSQAQHIVWMHGYDEGLTMLSEYMRFDQMVTVSKHNAHRILEESYAPLRVDYAYNPIDEKSVQSRGQESASLPPTSSLRLIAVGRNTPEKGFIRLVRCAGNLLDSGLDFQLVMVGDGPEHTELTKIVQQHHWQDHIILLGADYNPHRFTSRADLFVCSSFSEGYSTACVEAVMLGVPVLSTPVSGAQEIVEQAGAGWVTGMSDEELEKALAYVISHPEQVQEAKQIVIKNRVRFSRQATAERLYHILGL